MFYRVLFNWPILRTRLRRVRDRALRLGRGAPYDAWLHLATADACNLRCSYCISDSPDFPAPKRTEGRIAEVRIEPLLRSLRESGRTYKIVFAGSGEPLLVPNIVETLQALTRDHYVSLHTNLTVHARVREICEAVDPARVIKVHASLHYDELERIDAVERFVECYRRLQRSGFRVAAGAVAHPELLPRIPQIIGRFWREGIALSWGSFIGVHEGREYPDAYDEDQRRVLGLEDPAIFRTKGRLCNAGFNVGWVMPGGEVRMCGELEESVGNIYERIEFRDDPIVCPVERCRCPFYAYDPRLFEAASRRSIAASS